MTKNDRKPEPVALAEIATGRKFRVPLYQRNYAWTEEEIQTLLQDLWDSYKGQARQHYYLGSIVVQQKEQANGVDFLEVVDGQQRLTTIFLMDLVFGLTHSRMDGKNKIAEWLKFEARQASNDLFEALQDSEKNGEGNLGNEQRNILNAWKYIKGWKSQKIIENDEQSKGFVSYVKNSVFLFLVHLPDQTDLNHYFEIMNNRGEQLERHEILKARLLEAFNSKTDSDKRHIIALIWDACADMNGYVLENLKRRGVLENLKRRGIEDLSEAIDFQLHDKLDNPASGETPARALEETQKDDTKNGNSSHKDISHSPRFRSIVNFPNFLLIVLYLYLLEQRNSEYPSLDDKQLIKQFDVRYFNDLKIFDDRKRAWDFIGTLLKYRQLLDMYVIKREQPQDGSQDYRWTLKRWRSQDTNLTNTYEKGNDRLIAVLSMLHVSHPTQSHKRWLVAVLRWLERQQPDKQTVDAGDYQQYLDCLATVIGVATLKEGTVKNWDKIIAQNNLDHAECFTKENVGNSDCLDKGTATPHYLFHWLDYLILKLIQCDSRPGMEIKIKLAGLSDGDLNRLKEKAKKFRFTMRSSVEHFQPQTPDDNSEYPEGWSEDNIDCFGNLCLVHSGFNSSLGNNTPSVKAQKILDSRTLVSLVLAEMVARLKPDDEWTPKQAQVHRSNMIELMWDEIHTLKCEQNPSAG